MSEMKKINRDGGNIESWTWTLTKVSWIFLITNISNSWSVGRYKGFDEYERVDRFEGVWAFRIGGQRVVSGHEAKEKDELDNSDNLFCDNYCWIL